jgi:hypothetical protein
MGTYKVDLVRYKASGITPQEIKMRAHVTTGKIVFRKPNSHIDGNFFRIH